MSGRAKPTRLAEHDAALDSMLAPLLAEVPSDPDARCEEPAQVKEVTADAEAEVKAENPYPLKGETVRPLCDPGDASDASPAWANTDFRALLFHVGGFRFAIPLVLMRGIAMLPERRTRIPGQPGWHLGVVPYREQSVVVADLGELIGVAARCEAPRYLLVIGDGCQALTCDRIEDAALVRHDAVRWRRSVRPGAWLAGLLVENMCVLLNVDALSEVIRHG